MEWYKKYRPTELSQVLGQDQAVQALKKFLGKKELPHGILFTGPSGTGKTTLARILATSLGVRETDYQELNTADLRGIETVRDLRKQTAFGGMFGKLRAVTIDECHQLTNDAQEAMLKLLEDAPPHLYIILGTTEPRKLKPTLVTRCQHFKLEALSDGAINQILIRVVAEEDEGITEKVFHRIVEVANGSARQAIQLLEMVCQEDDESKQLKLLKEEVADVESIALCRALCNPSPSWSEVAEMLKSFKERKMDPEGLRLGVLGYAAACLLGAKGTNTFAKRARFVMMPFSYNLYDTKFAGLVAACWDVINHK